MGAHGRQQVVLNPGAGPLDIADLDLFLEQFAADQEPMVDVGGGMLIPLRELAETLEGDDADD
jgi:hypothetical protein